MPDGASPSVLPCGVPDFPRAAPRPVGGETPAVTRPARTDGSADLGHPPAVGQDASFGEDRATLRAAPTRRCPRRRLSTNSPHTRHSRLAPRASAASSWSSVRLSGASVHNRASGTPPVTSTEDLDVLGVEGLEGGVLGLEAGSGRLARDGTSSPWPLLRSRRRRPEPPRSRRFGRPAACERLRGRLQDPGFDHRVALDAEKEVRAPPERLGHRDSPRRPPRRAAGRPRRCARRAEAPELRVEAPTPPCDVRRARSAPGFVGSRFRSPARSRFARCA